jgi:serine/threonine-protein kinase
LAISIEPGRVIAGKYRLERPLAQGGMGAIWVARQLHLDVTVAIKFMTPEVAASSEARGRFEREAKASALLKSPNAVQVHDYGVEEGTPYLVMELLEGEDLEARLARAGRLSPADTAIILEQACKGLRRAHEADLVHRDLKPQNLFLARHGDDEVVKILDFGIAKVTTPGAPGKTRMGALLGTPHYMSPEQTRSAANVDLRSDLWSLGVIAYRALTGRLPFPGDDIGDLLVEICTDSIPVPSSIAPGLGPEVDRFFDRALARDPAQRFQSAREFSEALSALARGPSALGASEAPAPIPAWAARTHGVPVHTGPTLQPPASAPPPGPAPPMAAALPPRAGHDGAASDPIPRALPRARRTGIILGAVAASVVLLGVGALIVRPRSPRPRHQRMPQLAASLSTPQTTMTADEPSAEAPSASVLPPKPARGPHGPTRPPAEASSAHPAPSASASASAAVSPPASASPSAAPSGP